MLTDADWVEYANQHLTSELSALNAQFLEGSSSERWLRMSYQPGRNAINHNPIRSGLIAEMLDQTAIHCGYLVTGYPCATTQMELVIMRPATACCYVATGRLIGRTAEAAFLSAELADEAGFEIATIRAAAQVATGLTGPL
ncbi:hypothetical protein A5624_10490 [Mycobacterium sp. 1482292.6]|uniref:hypothetical protein n=1 Tax=unclassified Mycobacterium TaxID=2642494 RepID=UPI0007FFAC95|nr:MULTISPECIES: hypothetical protein [unclassified Mycobacterium]OBJ12672.1 hypothetical protein A5624_10490 [Mycobacterium sp. 1482292.6]OBJ22724.1 hypothetical protein A5622_14685 [Mycobacterium sp. 1245801.1]